MRDIEHELRTMMQRRAELVGDRPRLSERVRRRARRRQALVATSAGALAVVAGLGAFTGVAALLERSTGPGPVPAQTPTPPTGVESNRGLVARGEFGDMQWWLYAREGADDKVCRFVRTEQEDGGGGGGPICETQPNGEISLGNLSGGGDWLLIDGMVPIDVERVALELTSGKTRELELYDSPPSVKRRVRFFVEVLPLDEQGEIVAYDRGGEIFDRQNANLTAGLEGPGWTGRKVVIAEGEEGDRPWKMEARPTKKGPCVEFTLGKFEMQGGGGGCDYYGHYERKLLSVHQETFERVPDVTPVFGSLSSEVGVVRVEMEDGSRIPVEGFSAPEGFDPKGLEVNDVRFYVAFPPLSTMSGTLDAMDASGAVLQEHRLCQSSSFAKPGFAGCTDDNTPD